MSRTEEALSEVASADAPTEGEPPRLAAMVFTDVVGYSARMQANERETIAAVQADFDRMRALCAANSGEVLNTMGDGMMLCFPGAVAAMQFALAMQTEFGERAATPAGRKGLKHRVGIHIGDVYRVPGGHMAGDGVNIAARLEPHAEHGGIAISQIVYESVKGKVNMRAHMMGPKQFKNIAQPMMVWGVKPDIVDHSLVRPISDHAEESSAGAWIKRVVWLAIILVAIDIFWYDKDPVFKFDTGIFAALWQKVMALFR